MSQPPYKTYDPNVDTQADLVAQLTTDNPLTLYHGTSEKKYDAVHKPKPHLSSGAKGDFGWGGTNSALYTTHSQGVADFYGRQAAETDRSARYVILKGQLNRSTVKLLEITSIPTWQSVVAYGWQRPGASKPAVLNVTPPYNVVAGWVSTYATVGGQQNYWPVKYNVAGTDKFVFDFQYAILDQAILDAITWTVTYYNAPT